LTNNDPELLSASIRRLAALAQEKQDNKPVGGSGSEDEEEARHSRRRELENMGTPYISIPGGRALLRTPVGARGWDTPVMRAGEGSTRRRPAQNADELDELEDEFGSTPGPSRPVRKRRPAPPVNRLRDDLSLDAFQRNYTSEDNASFVQIVEEENKRRCEDRWGWAWEAERKAEQRRLEGEERRKTILDSATSGGWMVDGEGRRLIGGPAEGGRDRAEGEVWAEERKLSIAPSQGDGAEPRIFSEGESAKVGNGAIVPLGSAADSAALVRTSGPQGSPDNSSISGLTELPVLPDHPLNIALINAGLPATALVSVQDGAIVPRRETANGEDGGRGRGDATDESQNQIEKAVLGDETREHFLLGGSGADQWAYKVSWCTM